MSDRSPQGREFTGKHMLAVMIAFFGVIIAVNVTMATLARTSWSGLVVQNSYVAGQAFNRKAEEGREQAALGWQAGLSVADGTLRFTLADAEGRPVPLDGGTAMLRRPVGDADDAEIFLLARGDALEAAVTLDDGAWIVEVHAQLGAEAGLDRPYRETRRIQLRGGAGR